MTSKRVLAGCAALGGLSLIAFLGAFLEWWPLVVLALAGMVCVVGVVALNTNLLLRAHRKAFDRAGRVSVAAPTAAAQNAPAASQAEIAGTVRLLQAQYVARLDRAQSALERAAARMERDGAAPMDSPFAHLPHGSMVLLHRLDEASLAHAKAALAAGHQVSAVVADSADRERLEASGLGDAVTQVSDAGDAGHAVTVVLPGTD